MLPVALIVDPADDEVELPLVEDELPEELNWRTAKSTLPEVGLMSTSLIVPRVEPEELCTWEPVNCEARTACLPELLPVALRVELLLLEGSEL